MARPTARPMTRAWAALVVLLAGGFLPPLDFFIVNVALSSIQESLGASPAELQLVISAYASAYAVFLITGGRLGDLYGRRRCFLSGLVGFTVASLGCGLAPSAPVLLVSRFVQGASAAIIQPQVLGSIRALFPEERALARAMNAYGIMMGMAGAIGQFSGGALIQWNLDGLGWRTVFLLPLPVCALILLLGARLVPETGRGGAVKLDLLGAALITLSLAAVVVPLSEGRQQGWPAWVFAALASVVPLVWAFLTWEARLRRTGGMPLVDLTLFRIPSFRRGVLVATLFFFTTSFYLLFGLYQQEGRGVEPLQTGLAIVPYGVGLFVGPLLTAPLVALRPRLLVIGMSIQVAFYILIGVLVAAGIEGPSLPAAVFLAGLGQGIAFPRLFATVLGDVPPAQAGVAAGITNSALQVGAAVSVAGIGSLFFAVLGDAGGERAYAHAFSFAQWAVSAGLLLGMIIAIPSRRRVGA
ncbi:MAG TPA: MFS transporter [Rhodopila sp.]|uniref:MFS transporter n=1 Tax=Rhodopila sp. TaxID=2480087 RepID=UPI002BC2DDEC|nr:MFS transporter [Rhodopila sp.]HVY14838.1 MFS transporter [Rhodopila sp.]